MLKKLTLNRVNYSQTLIIFSIAFVLLCVGNTFAQNPLWILPTNNSNTSSYYDWVIGTTYSLPTTDPSTGLAYTDPAVGYVPSITEHTGAANCQVDRNGNLLFFIVGGSIYDNLGRTIHSINTSASFDNDEGFSEIQIVPDPSNCQRFYIFTTAKDSYYNPGGVLKGNEFTYAILDVSEDNNFGFDLYSNPNANGRLYDVNGNPTHTFNSIYDALGYTPHLFPYYLQHRAGVKFSVSKKNVNDGSYLLIFSGHPPINYTPNMGEIPGEYLPAFVKVKIGVNGLTYLGLTNFTHNSSYPNDVNIVHLNNSTYLPIQLFDTRLETEIYTYNDGTYRVATLVQNGEFVFSYKLDANYNYIPNSVRVMGMPIIDNATSTRAKARGLEISPNGQYLYITHSVGPNFSYPISVYDIDAYTAVPTSSMPWMSQLDNELQFSQIETYNDKMYLATSTNLHEISNVNNPTNTSYDPNYLSINYIPNYYYYPNSSALNNPDSDMDKVYTLPDQIDGEDYFAGIPSNPSCCIALTVFDKEIFNAHTDASYTGTTQIWTPTNNPLNGGTGAEATIRKELNIPAGYKIIIKNMVIKFHPEAEVNIRRGDGTLPGGQLILEKSTLTTYDNCGQHKLWQGVDVEGYVGLPQVPLNNTQQGLLDVKTGSKIEYAYIGAETIQKFGQWPFLTPDANYAGGIVRTKGGTWRNNQIDIRLQNYDPQNTYFNQSYINNSLFITDEVLDPQPKQIIHINLFDVTNVLIQGNTFVNAASNLYLENRRGYGILSVNSKFTVTPYPSNQNPNIFRKLTYGVYAQSANSFESAFIDKNVFRNNQYGVVLRNVDFSRVTRNNFRVAENSLGQKTVGINLVNSTGYKVEGNTLSSMLGTSQVGNTYGIVVDNSGEANNLVYRNTLLDLLIGCQSQRINAPMNTSYPNSYGGLKWQCNNFKQKIIKTDFALTSGRMDYQQGVTAGGVVLPQFAGARNKLSHDVPAGIGQYDIAVNNIPTTVDYGVNYGYYPSTFYSSNSITEPQWGNYSLPQVNGYVPVSLTAVVSPFVQFNYNQSCPSHIKIFIPGGISPISQGSVLSVKDQITSVQNTLNSVDQQALLNAINSGAMSNGQLKNLLLQNSPMLSDEVIIAYILSNPPNGHLLQVLFNNGPLSSNVIQTLNDNNALPGWWLYMLNNYFQGVSPYNQMVGQLNYLNSEKDNLINEAIIYYTLTDTTILNPMDSVLAYLQLDGDNKIRRQQIVDAYIYKKDVQTASVKNNALINDYGQIYFTTLATERINNTFGVCVVNNIDTNLQSKAVVQDIALNANNRIIKSKAKCLLKEYFNPDSVFVYIEDLDLPTNSNSNRLSNSNQDTENTKAPEQLEIEQTYIQPFELSIYPNPASHKIHIAIKGLDETENAIVEVVNVAGKVVFSGTARNTILDVDVSNLPNGLYFVMIRTEKQILKVEKIVVE